MMMMTTYTTAMHKCAIGSTYYCTTFCTGHHRCHNSGN